MKLPINGWIIIGTNCDCDKNYSPHELFYHDLDLACTDAKERNKDHAGHKVVAVKVRRTDKERILKLKDRWKEK